MKDKSIIVEEICTYVSKRVSNNGLPPIDLQRKRFNEIKKNYNISERLQNHITNNILGI